jgi:hypothetical protein
MKGLHFYIGDLAFPAVDKALYNLLSSKERPRP